MMKTKIILYLSLLCFFLVSCDKEVFVDPEGGDTKGGSGSRTPVDRTVLIYMAAENNLSNDAGRNIEALIDGSVDGNLNGGNLLVYVDRVNTLPCLIKIEEDTSGKIVKDTIEVYAEQNSASAEVMKGVINRVIKDFPASSYGLMLWSHGTGWLPVDYTSMFSTYAFGQDGNEWMEINDVRDGLPDHVFDFIIFDACYMSSIEVVYALKDKADYILGSPNEIISWGFPYSKIIEPMFSSGKTVKESITDMGVEFFNYYDAQSGVARSGSICLVYTPALNELATVTREILLDKEEETYALNLNTIQNLHYPHKLLYDFEDFVCQLANEEQRGRFKQSLSSAIPYKVSTPKAYYARVRSGMSGTVTIDQERFCGLTSYILREEYPRLNEWYTRLDWYKDVFQ